MVRLISLILSLLLHALALCLILGRTLPPPGKNKPKSETKADSAKSETKPDPAKSATKPESAKGDEKKIVIPVLLLPEPPEPAAKSSDEAPPKSAPDATLKTANEPPPPHEPKATPVVTPEATPKPESASKRTASKQTAPSEPAKPSSASPKSSSSPPKPTPTPVNYAVLPPPPGLFTQKKPDHMPGAIEDSQSFQGIPGGIDATPANENERKKEAQALAVYQEGFQAPAYRVEGLTSELIRELVRRDIGQLVAIHAAPHTSPSLHETFIFSLVDGEPASPRRAHPGWEHQVAQRSITLGGELGEKMKRQVRVQYGEDATAYLFLTPTMDLMILEAQLEACQARGVPLDEAEVTVGHFDLTMIDHPFSVTRVVTKTKKEDAHPLAPPIPPSTPLITTQKR